VPVIAVPLALQHRGYIDHWIEAGFECGTPIKNTGAGAAMMRIEAARRVFSLPAAPAQLVCVIRKRLADAFDVLDQRCDKRISGFQFASGIQRNGSLCCQ
jgi:hypothetical protein